jgi:hypothetical protein
VIVFVVLAAARFLRGWRLRGIRGRRCGSVAGVLASFVVGLLFVGLVVAGLRRLAGTYVARLLVACPARQRTYARRRSVYPGPGFIAAVAGSLTGRVV